MSREKLNDNDDDPTKWERDINEERERKRDKEDKGDPHQRGEPRGDRRASRADGRGREARGETRSDRDVRSDLVGESNLAK